LLLLFPIFKLIGGAANPELNAAAVRAPVVIERQACAFNPFARQQENFCGRSLGELTRLGVQYRFEPTIGREADADRLSIRIGNARHEVTDTKAIQPLLEQSGYRFEKVQPGGSAIAVILVGILALGALSGMTYGPVAALLSELFPPRIRYSSMSIPYHIGTGYFGGFLPVISQYIIARTGDPYSGLWYTFAVVAMALVVTLIWLPETVDKKLH
jgi:hypothetical protein